ncbi:hypothetical protein MED134_07249 [Dokdonia sp. MED134]|uniref:hypothetical protein n=1 Tax=Dokdonia sp. MED134 TaxID=313590 RepID=UPI000068AC3B|nr:hypothetical protein [Dokdonia sp. MED134]EAQ40533.1 hypothetical protein MED134_07249 [Dokdonia sp. MED134]
MVDELELLKKDWQKQEDTLPKYTKEDLYPMLLKKSSSIVKLIFIISLIEFAFWIVLSFAFNDNETKAFEKQFGLQTFDTIVLVVHLTALVVFALWFYKNFKKIQATDSAKVLMKNIIKTRNTVKYYIWFSMAFVAIASTIAYAIMIQNNPALADENLLYLSLKFIVVITIALGLLWGLYRIIYGLLLRKLNRNYRELKKLEI